MKIQFLIFILYFTLSHVGISQNIIVKPYLQDVTTNSAKVMFETDVTVAAVVIYGESPFALLDTVVANSQAGNGSSKIFTVQLTPLIVHTKYYYKVLLLGGTSSFLYNFTTLNEQSKEEDINFVAVSDMQMQSNRPTIFSDIVDLGILPIVNAEVDGGLDNLHGILIPGDLVQTGGNYSEWQTTFFDKATALFPYVPIYPVPGNHEYGNGGLPNYIKYFDLPLNGSTIFPEQWWYKDMSNIKLIGLNSNSENAEQDEQLIWLQSVLTSACSDTFIDFVFLQLHHPYKSEQWTPGESSFTGEVITLLENFTNECAKPSIHFFGHTHAYSRGQSKLHQHVWVNAASAGGAIDYWCEYPNNDYDEYSHSEDEYGFVLIKSMAGPDPEVLIQRFTRGDDIIVKNNIKSDEIKLKKVEFSPKKPTALYPVNYSEKSAQCIVLKASEFLDPDDFHQASHWQVSSDTNFTTITSDIWKQHENLYNEIDSQLNDDLTDQEIIGLLPENSYYWRVRYRDQYLQWSEWSDTLHFVTELGNATINLLVNPAAESGTSDWIGDIESLTNNECNSVPVYAGNRFFGVGGICANEQDNGLASQIVDVSNFALAIDNNKYKVFYGGYMRTFGINNDLPEISVEFLNANDQIISTTPFISNNTAQWQFMSSSEDIPFLTRKIKFVLKGTRLSGSDNDSYFDELTLKLAPKIACKECFGESNIDQDQDGWCSDLDCNDSDPLSYPGALELCDLIDNNCDGNSDSGNTATWNGLGDGQSWDDPLNWSQSIIPLPCQHVIIDILDTILINSNPVVKSIYLGAQSVLNVNTHGQLSVNSQNNATHPSFQINGIFTNEGKLDIKNSTTNGIHISGIFNNSGRVYINNVLTQNIIAQSSGILNNTGLIKSN